MLQRTPTPSELSPPKEFKTLVKFSPLREVRHADKTLFLHASLGHKTGPGHSWRSLQLLIPGAPIPTASRLQQLWQQLMPAYGSEIHVQAPIPRWLVSSHNSKHTCPTSHFLCLDWTVKNFVLGRFSHCTASNQPYCYSMFFPALLFIPATVSTGQFAWIISTLAAIQKMLVDNCILCAFISIHVHCSVGSRSVQFITVGRRYRPDGVCHFFKKLHEDLGAQVI